MSELQPGMLAMIVGCATTPVNIGKIVTLAKFISPGEMHKTSIYSGDGPCWVVEGDGIIATSISGAEYNFGYSFVKRQYLMPIKPEADPLDVTNKEELHA